MAIHYSETLWSCDLPLAKEVDMVLLDLDGVVYLGANAVPGAAAAIAGIRGFKSKVGYVTNNSSREPESVSNQLERLGIPSDPAEIVSSAHAAALLLAQQLPSGAPVLVVGGTGLRRAVQDVGLSIVSSAHDDPAAVVQGFSPELGWSELAEATYALRQGAFWVATNMDLSLPTERGLAPGCGALVGAIRLATGLEPVSAGKPEAALFEQAVVKLGGGSALMVGDRLDTDVAGANAAGIPGMAVLTGVARLSDVLHAVPQERPRFISYDVQGVLDPHPAPHQVMEGIWECRGARAFVGPDGLELVEPQKGAEPVDLLRAACAATWSTVDSGTEVNISVGAHTLLEEAFAQS